MATSSPEFAKTGARPLYEQVCEHLRRQYEGEPMDVALPSLRQLSESLGVNHITISRALRQLEGEGILRVVPGKGTFVAKPDTQLQTIELVILYTQMEWVLATSRHMCEAIQENLPEGYSFHVNTLLVPPVPDVDAYLQGMQARKTAAVAFLGYGYLPYPDSFRETQLIHEVAQSVPVVLIGKEHGLLKLDSIFCDPAAQMRTFLEECHLSGARRFDYFGVEETQTHLQHRLDEFKDFLLAHGLKWQRPQGDEPNLRAIDILLDAKPDVVIASTAHRAQVLVIEAQRRGYTPGIDFQILCFAGCMDEVGAIAPYVNVIDLEEEAVGRCVIHRIQGRLSGQDKLAPVVRRVPAKLVRQEPATNFAKTTGNPLR